MNHSTLRWGMLYTQHSGAEGAGPTPSPMMRNEGGGGVLGSRVTLLPLTGDLQGVGGRRAEGGESSYVPRAVSLAC